MKPTKTVFGALTAAMVIGACGGGMSGLSRTEIGQIANEVETSLDDWHDAAARGDFERYFAHFSDAGMFLGTDATERWSVAEFRDYAREPFSDGEGWVMRSVRRSVRVSSAGDVAWFEEDLETVNLGPCRGSGVFVLEAGRWKIAQYNLTITVPNERFAEVRSLLSNPALDGEGSGAGADPADAP